MSIGQRYVTHTTAPDIASEPEQWRLAAECQWTDPEVFFPEPSRGAAAAKKICGGCTVRAECLADALEFDERHGVRGGLTDRERRRLKRGAA